MRTRWFMFCAAATATAATLVLTEDTTHACAGFFTPDEEISTVDSHRIVVSLGLEESVLWDQIVYAGSPEEFVWVLPVPTPEVTVELADPAFFNELDRQTAPVVRPWAPLNRSCGSRGFGCAAADGSYVDSPEEEEPVIVHDHDVVGPYETVTISATDPDALYVWLESRGYAIVPDARPAIKHYVELEHAFVVLRLRPKEDVQAMQPVRVRYPGFMGTFPLRMVAVGAEDAVDLSLWILAEQRYEAQNYGTLELDPEELSWDWERDQSSYHELFDATLARGGNRAWIVEYAERMESLYLPFEDADIARAANPAPYVTRLRTRLPVEHLDEDLLLAPADDASSVSRSLLAHQDLNRPEDVDCGAGGDGFYCSVDTGSGAGAATMAGLIALGLMLVLRRRRAR